VRIGVEHAQVPDPTLALVMDVPALLAAAVAELHPAGVRVELDPHLRSWPLLPRLEPLDQADSVPLPASEPADRLGLGHGGLLVLDASNTKLLRNRLPFFNYPSPRKSRKNLFFRTVIMGVRKTIEL
jgi:hypothetical protein